MRAARRRPATILALAAAVLVAGAVTTGQAATARQAGPAAGPEGADIVYVPVSGPVAPVAGVDGHRPTVAAPAGAAEAAPGPSGPGLEAGTESIVGGRDDRVRVTATATYPNSAVGQIDATFSRGGSFSCTGFLIDDNTLLTSAHCAFDPDLPPFFFDRGQVATATFAPGRNRNVDPFGSCPVEGVWYPSAWADHAAAAHDIAVMNLAPGCDAIGTQTGTFGLFSRAGSLAGVRATVQGYPVDQWTVFSGTQKRMRDRIVRSQKRFGYYPMDTGAGQSGSPVWKKRAAGDCTGPCVLLVHGYGTDPGAPGPAATNNGGVRLTAFRIAQILDVAAQNDP